MSMPRYTHMASTDTISKSSWARASVIACADFPEPVGPTSAICLQGGNRDAGLVARCGDHGDDLPEQVMPAAVGDECIRIRAGGDAVDLLEVHELVLRRAARPPAVVTLGRSFDEDAFDPS